MNVVSSKSSYIRRIQFLRGIPSNLIINDIIKCTIICCDEFNHDLLTISNIKDDNLSNRFVVSLIESQSDTINSEIISYNQLTSVSNKLKLKYDNIKHTMVINFKLPSKPGFFYMSIDYNVNDNKILIISLQSDIFKIHSKEEYIQNNMSYMVLCTSYRTFILKTNPQSNQQCNVYIKEEYGATLGSHVYDSSIVYIRYLDIFIKNQQSIFQNNFINHINNNSKDIYDNKSNHEIINNIDNIKFNILELGAGCGLISIWIYKLITLFPEIYSYNNRNYFYDIYCTDKSYQLNLINHNINLNIKTNLNHHNIQLISKEFDWFDLEHINIYKIIFKYYLDFMIACDVFYDHQLAYQLLKVIQILSIPNKTKIIIVQKLRNINDINNNQMIDLFKLKDIYKLINIKQEYIEYNVIVWSFMISEQYNEN